MATPATSPSASYIFKLSYDDGPVHVARRYGYTGKIDSVAVYQGLLFRTAQSLSLAPGSFTLTLRDHLGRTAATTSSAKRLDSFEDFVEHVCRPLEQNPCDVKVDDQGRRVLGFIVEKKVEETSKDVKTDQTERVDVEAGSSKTTSTNPSIQKPGYHPAYSTTSSSSSSLEAKSDTVKEDESALLPSSEGVDKKKAGSESWSTVRTMLETFVSDLNIHLADTFGDEAGSFRLKTTEAGTQPKEITKSSAEVKTEPEHAAQKVEESKAVHKHVFCDRCLKTICGSRFKCRSCSNYDLCESCIDFRTQFHPGAHAFNEIVRPGTPAVASLRGAVQVEEQPLRPAPTPPTAPLPSPRRLAPATTTPRPVVHNATCDLCQRSISGTRYKCLNCPDWDACEGCYKSSSDSGSDRLIEHVHPNHSFVAIHDPRDLHFAQTTAARSSRASSSGAAIHHHVRCDGCQAQPIRGIRYKCVDAACPDFDLCQNCQADPIARHPLDHAMLQLRQPARPNGTRPGSMCFGVSRPAATAPPTLETIRRAQDMSQRLAAPSRPAQQGGGNPVVVSVPQSAATESQKPVSDSTEAVVVPVQAQVDDPSLPSPTPGNLDMAGQDAESAKVGVEQPGVAKDEIEDETVSSSSASSSSSELHEEGDASVEADEALDGSAEAIEKLGCSYVADITLRDGSVVPAGSEFCKVWRVRNSGTVKWSKVTLVNVGGFNSMARESLSSSTDRDQGEGLEVADLEIGQETEVQCDCKAPEEDGRYMSFFRLQDEHGNKFGDRFWLDITVESDGTVRNSSSMSLSSSSIVAPALDVRGHSGRPDALSASTTGARTSTATTTSSAAPSTTFSLSSVPSSDAGMSDFESIVEQRRRGALSTSSRGFEVDDDSESEESSELEEDSDDSDGDFVVLSASSGGAAR